MIDLDEVEEVEEGAPAWMATFADLMSLLVCFFVLLLSFSEMDVVKYRTIAGSLKEAFGVQSKIEARSIPKGTSVIAREFSPGTPQPIVQPRITQQTINDSQRSLQMGSNTPADTQAASASQMRQKARLREMLSTSGTAETLRELLRQGIVEGKIDIESGNHQVMIRIRERGSFASGQAVLDQSLLPLVAQLRYALQEIVGIISVEGHTDDVPIRSMEFDSNWNLSASRALSLARELMNGGELEEARFVVVGHADTRPLRPNDSVENRAANRRVEIVVRGEISKDQSPWMSALPMNALPDAVRPVAQ